MIPQTYIEDLLKESSIVAIIGAEIKLSKSGMNYVGVCPFHFNRNLNDSSRSFTVSETKAFYHCFHCNAHGSVLNFLIKFRSMTFPEAVTWLAYKVGFRLPEESAATKMVLREARDRVFAKLDSASTYYEARLRQAVVAIDLLKSRGITGRTAKKFRIGYAPNGWENLKQIFKDDYDSGGVDSGIIVRKENGKIYDKFRDRIVFPLMYSDDRVHGLLGLSLNGNSKGSVPMYLRTSATILTSPTSVIFGWSQADRAISTLGFAIVVHDCIDLLAMSQHGFENVLSTPNVDNRKINVKYTEAIFAKSKLIICCFTATYDGFRAAWRTLLDSAPCLDDSHEIRFAMLPANLDISQILKQPSGCNEIKIVLDGSVSLFDFALQNLAELHDMTKDIGRASALRQFNEICQQMPQSNFRHILEQRAQACCIDAIEMIRTANEHDQLLVEAINSARRELTIVSPWISRQGISRFDLCRHIRAATDRGVNISVYTDIEFNGDRRKSANGGDLFDDGAYENLIAAGAHVIFAKKIYSKWVLRDDNMLCVGSFNWLSAARNGRYMRHEVSVVHRGPIVPVHAARLMAEVKARIADKT